MWARRVQTLLKQRGAAWLTSGEPASWLQAISHWDKGLENWFLSSFVGSLQYTFAVEILKCIKKKLPLLRKRNVSNWKLNEIILESWFFLCRCWPTFDQKAEQILVDISFLCGSQIIVEMKTVDLLACRDALRLADLSQPFSLVLKFCRLSTMWQAFSHPNTRTFLVPGTGLQDAACKNPSAIRQKIITKPMSQKQPTYTRACLRVQVKVVANCARQSGCDLCRPYRFYGSSNNSWLALLRNGINPIWSDEKKRSNILVSG